MQTRNIEQSPPLPSIFLCPTGTGDNSNTLDKQVLKGCPVWGFTEGSAKRYIRRHMKPGDVLLFSKPGTGLFDRVGVVKEWRDDPDSAEGSHFWAPMCYNMGGQKKTNVRFTLLALLTSVTEVNMQKVGGGKLGCVDYWWGA